MTASPDNDLLRHCDFCGGLQQGLDRCSGCGANPELPLLTTNTKHHTSHTVKRNNKKRIPNRSGYFFLLIAVAFLAVFKTGYHGDNNTQAQTPNPPSAAITMRNYSGWIKPVSSVVEQPAYSEARIRKLLGGLSPTQLHYVGIDKSTHSSGRVIVNLLPNNKPTILVLSSYQSVSWQINNQYNNPILAIVYGSHHSTSSLQGDIPSKAKRILATSRIGDLTAGQSCSCVNAGVFQCTGNEATSTIQTLQALTTAQTIGLTTTDTASELSVPNRYMDSHFLAQQKSNQATRLKIERACLS